MNARADRQSKGRVIAIVAARVDSLRLPRKALIDVAGKPLILHVLERAARIRGISKVVLATTKRPVDDPLADRALAWGYETFRGATEDVACRMNECAEAFDAEFFVRLNGDCVLADAELISAGVELRADGIDLVSNLFGRTFPYGIAVEVIRTASLARARESMDTDDREHVTSYFYAHPDAFAIKAMLSSHKRLCRARLVVDTPEDLLVFRRIAAILGSQLSTATFETSANAYFEVYGSSTGK